VAQHYDVAIVGSGPAGIFAALEFCKSEGLDVLLLEKGRDLKRRVCPITGTSKTCPPCHPCAVVSGWGGAGAFSDGKLTLSPDVGGRLREYLGRDMTLELLQEVDQTYQHFGADNRLYGVDEAAEDLRRRASLAELRLVPLPLRHIGTERCRDVLQAMRDYLSPRVEIRTGANVKSLVAEDGHVQGIVDDEEQRYEADYVIVAPGREGADWLAKESRRLGLTLSLNPVDVGVRVEVPATVTEELTSHLYESKLEYFSKTFDDRIRTFCMCPAGEVTMESTGGADPVTTVNGHSYADRRTENTNFALLTSTTFTEPFKDPIAYGRYIARLANILSGGVIVQRLGDLLEGHRSTPERIERSIVTPTLKSAIPGDLSFVLPYRYLNGIIEMLQALDKLAPGVASRHTLLYGVEVKFYSSRIQLSPHLETQVANLFAAGDGAGVTRGLAQASAAGIVAAREILRRLGKQQS